MTFGKQSLHTVYEQVYAEVDLTSDPSRNVRAALLDEARTITSVDRNKAYGNPEDNFAHIASLWNAYLTARGKGDKLTSSQDVAHMMALMKIARLATNPGHRDSLVDIAGYAACAESCRVHSEKLKDEQHLSSNSK